MMDDGAMGSGISPKEHFLGGGRGGRRGEGGVMGWFADEEGVGKEGRPVMGLPTGVSALPGDALMLEGGPPGRSPNGCIAGG